MPKISKNLQCNRCRQRQIGGKTQARSILATINDSSNNRCIQSRDGLYTSRMPIQSESLLQDIPDPKNVLSSWSASWQRNTELCRCQPQVWCKSDSSSLKVQSTKSIYTPENIPWLENPQFLIGKIGFDSFKSWDFPASHF